MSYTVVVVTWRSAQELGRLVRSMNRRLGDEPELIVVDNASADSAEAEAGGWRGPTRFIGLADNVGYGAAANVGVEAASRDAALLLNPDTELVDASLGRLVRFALERGALAGPRVVNPDGSIQPSASGSPVGPWPWIGALIPGRLQPPPLRARTEAWRLERTVRVAWLTGACVAGPVEVLRQLGPFDPALHLFSEDLDLGLRAARAGVPSFFCPELCRIVHYGGSSSAMRFPDRGLALAAANRRAVLRRAYGPRRERAAWMAQRLNLRLRVLGKKAVGRDAARERAALAATAGAREVSELPRS